MVHYFNSAEGLLIFKGQDKYENEELLCYRFPEDVWFHVDDLSSAHVYLRMPIGMTFESIPQDLLAECCQLVKENSIEGCKRHEVAVVYTPADNILKRPEHDVGQVAFKDQARVRTIKHVVRSKQVLRPLLQTFWESRPDLQQQLLQHQQAAERSKAKALREEAAARKAELKEQTLLKEQMSYSRMWDDSLVQSNKAPPEQDDFM